MSETTQDTRPTKNNSVGLIVAAILLLVGVAAGAYWYFSSQSTDDQAVASVNGVEITRQEYERSVRQINSAYAAQGIDTTSAEVSASVGDQALLTLINRELMLQAASRANLSVDQAEIDAEYQNLLQTLGGEAGLSTALSETGMSDEDLRNDLRKDIMINKYLESNLGLRDVTVTDEEIETAYATAVEQGGEGVALPPLEDVRDLIRGQLANERQQQAINAELERLRGEATVEILI